MVTVDLMAKKMRFVALQRRHDPITHDDPDELGHGMVNADVAILTSNARAGLKAALATFNHLLCGPGCLGRASRIMRAKSALWYGLLSSAIPGSSRP
jgi:hypothetical protein